ncbi:hypothetical protein GC163_19005 [bacterium]|nr:hypothetical protein [bacterium]
MQYSTAFNRRDFLGTTAVAGLMSLAGRTVAAQESGNSSSPTKPLRIAAINSVYWLRSHAYHICGRMMKGYTWDGVHHRPDVQLVRMYNHQQPPNDIGPLICRQNNVELCDSVAAALGGPNGLDVDAVLIIIEHGDYPLNDYGQVLYPRYEMFEQVVEVFKKSGRSVPIFVDKHLSYDHQLATKMVQTSREMSFGLMAGSSLPVTWRIPEVEAPVNAPFTEGLVTFGFDRGTPEIYLFHALESLQVFMERRRGGETGVKRVQTLRGPAVWQAAEEGRWSWSLLEAALKNCQSLNVGSVRENVQDPLAVLVEYNDGTKGTVINLIEQTSEFGFAGTLAGTTDPVACCLYLPIPPAANFFNPLCYHIEQFFRSGQPDYPIERTWLTSTLCDFAMRSLHDNQQPISAAALDIHYQAPASSGFARGSWTNQLPR